MKRIIRLCRWAGHCGVPGAVAAAIVAATLAAAPSAARPAGALRVSSDGRTLVASGGEPFYYMADNAWELVARLTREEAVEYLDHRKAGRFTVIQLAAVTCFTEAGPNIYGDRAFDGTVDRPLVAPTTCATCAR